MPNDPERIRSQDADEVAVHAQPPPAVTAAGLMLSLVPTAAVPLANVAVHPAAFAAVEMDITCAAPPVVAVPSAKSVVPL